MSTKSYLSLLQCCQSKHKLCCWSAHRPSDDGQVMLDEHYAPSMYDDMCCLVPSCALLTRTSCTHVVIHGGTLGPNQKQAFCKVLCFPEAAWLASGAANWGGSLQIFGRVSIWHFFRYCDSHCYDHCFDHHHNHMIITPCLHVSWLAITLTCNSIYMEVVGLVYQQQESVKI